MNKTNLLKRTVMPMALMCSAMLFTPPMLGLQTVYAAEQQQGSISGTVVDSQGEPIIGASVVIVGGKTVQGTVTDFDGNFTLKVNPGTQLKISYVGYKELIVKASANMKITLEEEATMLQGVEIVAYGVQKKVTVTGALSSVKAEDLVRTPVSSVNNVLAGQLSGVTTVQYSGEPGSDAASIFVRGQATWVDSAPLIQVDGVEREMWDIDPNEIESITVLKDASATAVFGVRGANGVILITTKRGAEGKAKISINTSFSAVTPTKMIEQASSYDYGTFYNQMLANDGKDPMFSASVLQKFKDGSDPIRFPSMKWDEYIMKDVTLQQQHNINISGGNKTVKYFISAGMMTQDGIFKEFGKSWDYGYQYQRFNYRSNLDINVTKTTMLSFNIAGKVDDSAKPKTGQGSGGMIKAIYQATPFCSPGIIDGRYIVNTNVGADNEDGNTLPFIGDSPMTYYAYQPGAFHYNNNKLSMDLVLDQKLDFITKGLSLKLKGSYNSSYAVTKTLTAGVATYTPVVLAQRDSEGNIIYDESGNIMTQPTQYRKSGSDVDPTYSYAYGKGRDWYIEGSFNYNRSFGDHTITALALYNQSKEYYKTDGDGNIYIDIPRTYVGFVGRVTYDWKNRYMAEFNIGYNGSENFAPGKRFGTFPAGSIGWVMSDEPFFEPIKKVVSFLKLRASWGLVGNDKVNAKRFMYIADPYNVNQSALLERTGKDTGAFGYNFGIENGTTSKGAVEASKNYPDVSWEKAFKQDYGVDINFLDDRLRATFDYYREHRKDILAQDMTVPGMLGFNVPYTNFGEVDSWGWELSLNWQDKIGKNFRYWAKLNLSHNQNEIIVNRQAPQKNEYMYTKGHRIGSRSLYQFWKFYYEGAEADYEKEFGSPFPEQFVSELKPGDAVYVDLDKDGKIDPNDAKVGLGYTDDPEYIAGLSLGCNWKGFTFNAQLTGAWNVSRLISDVFRRPFTAAGNTTYGGLLQYHIDNTWTADNPSQDSEYPRATWANADQNYANSTLYEKDSKYLRLKTLQIAYDFNFPFMKKLGLNQLQLALSGYNLLTFSPYIWGDPEARASNAPSYPLQRTYTASLKLGF
ncbi:MAG: TonB-dependent receptor [Prevotella sp.]|jgi:TonB-linked SusC/RagA family outer membrane protein|nr:TonB-dependent receptor [Prevotella sp.]